MEAKIEQLNSLFSSLSTKRAQLSSLLWSIWRLNVRFRGSKIQKFIYFSCLHPLTNSDIAKYCFKGEPSDFYDVPVSKYPISVIELVVGKGTNYQSLWVASGNMIYIINEM